MGPASGWREQGDKGLPLLPEGLSPRGGKTHWLDGAGPQSTRFSKSTSAQKSSCPSEQPREGLRHPRLSGLISGKPSVSPVSGHSALARGAAQERDVGHLGFSFKITLKGLAVSCLVRYLHFIYLKIRSVSFYTYTSRFRQPS